MTEIKQSLPLIPVDTHMPLFTLHELKHKDISAMIGELPSTPVKITTEQRDEAFKKARENNQKTQVGGQSLQNIFAENNVMPVKQNGAKKAVTMIQNFATEEERVIGKSFGAMNASDIKELNRLRAAKLQQN